MFVPRSHALCAQRATSHLRAETMARLYGRRWGKARATFLSRYPLCVMCSREGRTAEATVVDHIQPHREDPKLFWDKNNWQPLCKAHHDITKQRAEKTGQMRGVDVIGRPLDVNHPWNK